VHAGFIIAVVMLNLKWQKAENGHVISIEQRDQAAIGETTECFTSN
jgi:hypothetical protein